MVLAVVTEGYGPPTVLRPAEITVGAPAPHQIRVNTAFAGVTTTDLAIRAGYLRDVYPVVRGSVLGFEAAGSVDAVGSAVTDVAVGDEVAVFMPRALGGYAAQVLADFWVRKPASVSFEAAAALPDAGQAAVRVLRELGVRAGETLLLLGGAGAVGTVATQLAVKRGVRVISTVREQDFAIAGEWGATPVNYRDDLDKAVSAVVSSVDAVMDASGRSDLPAAVRLAGGTSRVITLSDPRGADLGVRLSEPDPRIIPASLTETMDLLESGELKLREQVTFPLAEAPAVHAELETGVLRRKVVLRV